MKLAMIGLGRMGGNMVRRLMREGAHECVVHARHAESVREFEQAGAIGATSLADVVAKLPAPRVLWVMLPAGEATETTIAELGALASPGDIIIDGGNTFWKDDLARAKALREKGIHYVDVGVSGGVWGLERGYCLMIGGEADVVERLDPIFATLAPGAGDIGRTPGREGAPSRAERGYVHAGPNGAGHFVKMVHNGIEYGMMQAFAEGFDIMRNAATEAKPEGERLALNVAEVAEVWRRGSVVSSWLLDLAASALAKDGDLEGYSGVVADSGEGRWVISAAIEQATPANVLAAALFTRSRSRQERSFGDKLLSAMREGFGGHKEAGNGR
jgi:6-phosphogluconate dehydrogenase